MIERSTLILTGKQNSDPLNGRWISNSLAVAVSIGLVIASILIGILSLTIYDDDIGLTGTLFGFLLVIPFCGLGPRLPCT